MKFSESEIENEQSEFWTETETLERDETYPALRLWGDISLVGSIRAWVMLDLNRPSDDGPCHYVRVGLTGGPYVELDLTDRLTLSDRQANALLREGPGELVQQSSQTKSEGETQTFDESIVNGMTQALHEQFARHPELRSAAVVLDYRGSFNQSAQTGLWMNSEGQPVHRPEALDGLATNTLNLLSSQVGRYQELLQHLREHTYREMSQLTGQEETDSEQDRSGQ